MPKTRRVLCFERLERRELLAGDLVQLNYFPTWDGNIIRSTDVAGLTYHAPSGHMYLSDSEINELSLFEGNNVFAISLAGDQVYREIATGNSEPTGITFNEYDGFFYVSNDSADTITRYDDNFNVLHEVDTRANPINALDPEGITSNPVNGDVYVVDGRDGNREVLTFDFNLNLKSRFSVAGQLADAEGIVFNPVNNNLLVVSSADDGMFEYTLSGDFVEQYSFSGLVPTSIDIQGVAIAPTSSPNDASGALALYLADLGEDNSPDGAIYEFFLGEVDGSGNTAPFVSAGGDQYFNGTTPVTAFLDGIVSDDGRTEAVTASWSQVSGPGQAVFADPQAEDTNVTLNADGAYVLRLTVDDGQFVRSDEVQIFVNAPPNIETLDVQISSFWDDVEQELNSGSIDDSNGDLDIGQLGVGLRFNGIDIPQGATISNAYVQFTSHRSSSTSTTVLIQGHAADNSSPITEDFAVTNRPKTSADVTWSPPAWPDNTSGTAQRTPNLAPVIQEITDRSGWSSGNSLALFLTGSGARSAKTYDRNPQKAPRLVVEFVGAQATPPVISEITDQAISENTSTNPIPFTVGDDRTPPGNLTIQAVAGNTRMIPNQNLVIGGSGANRTITITPAPHQFGTTTISIIATDAEGLSTVESFEIFVDGVNDPPTANSQDAYTAIDAPIEITLTADDQEQSPLTYAIQNGPSYGTLSGAGTNWTYTPQAGYSGIDSFTFTANDGELESAAATVSISVNNVHATDFQVAQSTDDAEEHDGGAMNLSSIDLNMGVLWTGVRFAEAHIPSGATITNAYLQFTAFHTLSETTNLVIAGQSNDTGTFHSGNSDISSRSPTTAAVSWAPSAWNAGESGVSQQSPDLSAVIQELIDHPGWARGDPLTLLIQGTGHRSAHSFDSDPQSAPRLFVEFDTRPNTPPSISDVPDQTILANGTTGPLSLTISDTHTLPDSLALVATSTNAALIPEGNIVFGGSGENRTVAATPLPNQTGAATITITVTDAQGLSSSDLFQVTVNGTPPTISSIVDQQIEEDASTAPLAFTIGDGETPAAALWVTGASSNQSLIPNGNIVFGGSGVNRTVTVAPNGDQSGTATITVTVTDDSGDTGSETFDVIVTPVNDAPTAGSQNIATFADTPTPITLTGSDSEQDPLSYSIQTQPANGTLNGTGPNLTYTPNPGFSGTDSFTFQVNDGELESNLATVNINVAPNVSTLQVQVNNGNDDAEQTNSGSMALGSGDLDAGSKTAGIRFNGLDIPQGATITNAYVQFTADKSNATTTNLTIRADDSNHAAPFSTSNGNLTSRTMTSASAGWAVPTWTAGDAGAAQRTPDLAAVIQEVVDRGGWTNGNSLVLILSGSGDRAIQSFERDPASAATLFVEFSVGPDVNDPPVAEAQNVSTAVDTPLAITLTGSDPEQDPLSYSIQTQPANGTLNGTEPNLTYTPNPGFTGADSFTFQVNDGELDSNLATVNINVGAVANTIQAQALASSDDAEESGSGAMNLTSSDLDIGVRPVGIRFSGLNIPQGATITNAYLQFTADESGSTATNLTIAGHAADNAGSFTTANGNITSRPTTSATVNWSVPAWTVGESGAAQQSPDLTAMIQEIIGRGGWSSGNALALIITGSGARAAETADGDPSAAPRLVIEYLA